MISTTACDDQYRAQPAAAPRTKAETLAHYQDMAAQAKASRDLTESKDLIERLTIDIEDRDRQLAHAHRRNNDLLAVLRTIAGCGWTISMVKDLARRTLSGGSA